MAKSEVTAELAASIDRKKLGQIVLVLQGGGALGAYQGKSDMEFRKSCIG